MINPGDLMQLVEDGEMLGGLVERFRRRVGYGLQFGDTMLHLERAEHTLAKRMGMVCDVMEGVAKAESESERY